MSENIDKNVCPFCKKSNNCMANSNQSCWCNDIEVPLELRAFIPEDKKMKACICQSCILLFQNNKEAFIKAYGI